MAPSLETWTPTPLRPRPLMPLSRCTRCCVRSRGGLGGRRSLYKQTPPTHPRRRPGRPAVTAATLRPHGSTMRPRSGRPSSRRRGHARRSPADRLWAELKHQEPYLAVLERQALQLQYRDELDWLQLKASARGAVGWARRAGPDLLRTEWAYELAMLKLRRALEAEPPGCRCRS